jgi:cell division septum initiation protein DivIVA
MAIGKPDLPSQDEGDDDGLLADMGLMRDAMQAEAASPPEASTPLEVASQPEAAMPPETADEPESEFDTVRRGLAPDQVASYLKRVATSVLSLEARLSDTTSELLETRRERDSARAELQAVSNARDPYVNVSDRVTGLVLSFDHQMSGLLRDAEAEAERVRSEVRMEADRILAHAREESERIVGEAEEEADRTRADARMVENESRIRAGRLILEARQEADEAESHLATLRGSMLDTFRDIRERTRTALSEVEAVIESEAASDRLVIVDDAAESPSADLPEVPRPDL